MPPTRIAIGIDMEWPYKHHHDAVSGIMRYAKSAKWQCQLEPYIEYPHGTLNAAQRYDGVIARASKDLGDFARRTGLPAVNIWVNSPDMQLPRVHIDHVAVGRMAAGHLMDRGFRRVAFLGLRGDRNSDMYEQGLREALQERDIEVNARRIPQTHRSGKAWHHTRDMLIEWIKQWTPPIGVFTTDDLPARYLANICLEQDLRVPDDIALVGTGNNEPICESMEPTLSSIEQGYERIGYAAAELLHQIMEGGTAPEQPILIPPAELVARRSTDVFAVEDRLVAQALRVIWDRGHRPIGVDDIVEALPVTRRSLERRFRKVLGRSIHDEITRSRVERAKRLLVETDDAVQNVATASGFTNAEHLAKVFRRIEKTTPRAFRQRHAGG